MADPIVACYQDEHVAFVVQRRDYEGYVTHHLIEVYPHPSHCNWYASDDDETVVCLDRDHAAEQAMRFLT